MNLKNKIPQTVKLKTFVLAVGLICLVFLVFLRFSLSGYVSDVTDAYLTQPLQEASYIIGQYNSTYYYARNHTGYGTSANKGYEWLDDNKTTICQAANDALTSGGTIVLKDIEKPSGLTISDNVVFVVHYEGTIKYYTATASGKMGNSPVPVTDSHSHPNGTSEQTIFEITPSVVTFLYNVYFDFANLTQDTTLKVYNKINDTYQELIKLRLTIGTDERYGVVMKQLVVNTDIKFTLTSSIAEGADRVITYRYFKEEY